eukprot:1475817-Ditylum_brightwellii.AAC.1
MGVTHICQSLSSFQLVEVCRRTWIAKSQIVVIILLPVNLEEMIFWTCVIYSFAVDCLTSW